ncbi:MAG: hypothetical protein WDZ70_02215 [Candidatus Paceibacterota bacterium]
MFRFVEQLQKKPHHVRKNTAIGTSAIVTLLIAGVWISVSDFTPTESTGTVVVENERKSQVASPLRALEDDFSRVSDGFRGLIGTLEREDDGVEVVSEREPTVRPDIESSASEVDYSFE